MQPSQDFIARLMTSPAAQALLQEQEITNAQARVDARTDALSRLSAATDAEDLARTAQTTAEQRLADALAKIEPLRAAFAEKAYAANLAAQASQRESQALNRDHGEGKLQQAISLIHQYIATLSQRRATAEAARWDVFELSGSPLWKTERPGAAKRVCEIEDELSQAHKALDELRAMVGLPGDPQVLTAQADAALIRLKLRPPETENAAQWLIQ